MNYPDELDAMLEKEFPEAKKMLGDDAYYLDLADIGSHVLYEFVLCPYIRSLFEDEEKNAEEIKRVFAFLEKLSLDDNPRIGEVVRDTVLEGIWEHIKEAYKYAGPATRKNIQKVRNYFQPIDLPNE